MSRRCAGSGDARLPRCTALWRPFHVIPSPIALVPLCQVEAYVTDRKQLRDQLLKQCQKWIHLADSVDDAALHRCIEYKDTKGNSYSCPLASVLSQVFNHGTHHRGQITAGLTTLGRDFPALDMQARPEFFAYSLEPPATAGASGVERSAAEATSAADAAAGGAEGK